MRSVKLNEEAIKQLEAMLGEIPMKWASPIMNLLGQNIIEDPKPIGGGGGGGAPKPKPGA
jgi:hypothetical protein